MARYFKVTEIKEEDFVDATGETLGRYIQSTIPIDGNVFVAVDDDCEDEIYISLDCFDEESDSK